MKFQVDLLTDQSSWMLKRLEGLITRLHDSSIEASLRTDLTQCQDGAVLILVGYQKIIPKLQLSRFSSVLVIHESDLPKDRGWAPMSWQILRGTGEIVVSLIYASEEVDSGRIIDQIPIRLSGLELHNEWRTKQFVATERLIWNYLKNPSELEELARDQRGVPSYNRRRSPADSELDPNKSIASQFNLLRIADNDKYPAFFSLNGQKFEIAIRKANTEKGESV